MILRRLKKIVQENRRNQHRQYKLLKELEWAHVYHDSIRGIKWLENTPLNIGRWAGNYPFFYVLHRVLNDCKPTSIVEFGLGESSKFISKYLDHKLPNSNHTIIEQDANWKAIFEESFDLSDRSNIQVCPAIIKDVQDYKVTSYKNIEEVLANKKFDLYVIDGPTGSERFSRYDIVNLTSILSAKDEFIIILDDTNRKGERDTYAALIQELKNRSIEIWTNAISGNKELGIIVTEKYKHLCTI